MDGPRSARPTEVDAVSRLVDHVFFDGKPDEMRSRFPYFIHPDNCDNLLIVVDGERVVAHAGMTLRWALIGGASVRVACLGAVATDAAYRGRGLAGELVRACVTKARREGVDLMLISGDRPLYRRAGAATVGEYVQATFTTPAAPPPYLLLREGGPEDLAVCSSLYRRESVRFVREPLDWQAYAESQYAIWNRSKLWIAAHGAKALGYLIASEPREGNVARIAEYAGDIDTVAAACPAVLHGMGCDALAIFAPKADPVLCAALTTTADSLLPCPASGTVLIVNAPQLGERLRPWVAERVGTASAETFAITQQYRGFVVSFCGDTHIANDAASLAATIFGKPTTPTSFDSPFDQILPVQALWYGLNFV